VDYDSGQITNFDIDIVVRYISRMFNDYFGRLYSSAVSLVHYMPVEDFGKLMTDGPVITYRINYRQPGAAKGKPFSGEQFHVPRFISKMPDSLSVSGTEEYLMFYDNSIEFKIHSTNSILRDTTATKFEEFMILVREVVMRQGIEQMYMHSREDSASKMEGNLVYDATLLYYLRTKSIVTCDYELIKEIITTINVG